MGNRDRIAKVLMRHPDRLDGRCCHQVDRLDTMRDWALHVADEILAVLHPEHRNLELVRDAAADE